MTEHDVDCIESDESEETFITAPSSPILNTGLPPVYDPVVLNALWELLKQAHNSVLFNKDQSVSASVIENNVTESDIPVVNDRKVVVISSDEEEEDYIRLPSLTQEDLERFPSLKEAVYGQSEGRYIKCSKKKNISFESYIADPQGYDRLKTDPTKMYEPYSPEWYAIKRRMFFDSLGVVSTLGTFITYLLLFKQERRGRCVECHSTGDNIGMSSKSHAVAIKRRRHPLCLFCTR